MANQLISIGKILKPQGLHGQLRVLPLTDFPERFREMDKVIVNREGNLSQLEIEEVSYHQQYVLLKLKGISDASSADKLRGSLLQVRQDQLKPLPPGHYYHFQIIGLDVLEDDGRYLGKVVDIKETGSNDVYVVCDEETGKELLIPALKKVVQQIDIEKGQIIVTLPAGLED